MIVTHWLASRVVLAFLLTVAPNVFASPSNSTFEISALTSRDGCSIIECWVLDSVPVEAMSAINFAIGNTTKATWSTIEPRTTVGEAWAPSIQLSIVLNGLIRVTAPFSAPGTQSHSKNENGTHLCPNSTVGYFMPGTLKSSVLIAADTRATSYITGHFTEFPSNEPTILIQAPFVGNAAPKHSVLHDGPCF